MKKVNAWIAFLKERLFSNTYQLQRLVILTAIVLGVATVSFAGYYYYDRYYSAQPKVAEVSMSAAEQAVAEDPQNPDKRLALAETYMFNRRFSDAIAQAQQVMSAYPDNQRAWLILGLANALSGNPTEAVGPLQMYVDANKDSDLPNLNKSLQSAAYYLGDSYLQLGQPDLAVPVLEMAVQWNQTDADAMYKLGMGYLGVQTYDKAVDMFLAATTFVPDYTEAYQGMTAAFSALNEPDLVNYSLGMQAFSKKDYPTALTLLLKAAQAKPGFPPIFTGLGMTYEAMNDLEKAKSSYEAALQLDPANFTATTGLQRVEALLKK
jgi:tetratricopeptide (TPR) repeat protein